MLRSVALLNFGTRRARRSLSVRCKSAHATCKIQRSGRRYTTWWIHISRVLNERSTAVLCAIAAQPSAAPQRRSIADRATAIYGVKRLPGEAACVRWGGAGASPVYPHRILRLGPAHDRNAPLSSHITAVQLRQVRIEKAPFSQSAHKAPPERRQAAPHLPPTPRSPQRVALQPAASGQQQLGAPSAACDRRDGRGPDGRLGQPHPCTAARAAANAP